MSIHMLKQITENLYIFSDSCNVYMIRCGSAAILVDFGSGSVLDALAEIGIKNVVAILMTHHHRDQGQGLPRAVDAGIPIWVPQTEQDYFAHVDTHWQARPIYNNYDNRQDRFSLLESVPVAGLLLDYATLEFVGHSLTVLPTPGHTNGSITLLAEIDGVRCAFSGDLIYGPGKIWSLAATQWSYNGAEGVAASIPSLVSLKAQQPDRLLPSHGSVMDDPGTAIDLLVTRLWQLLQDRGQNPRLFRFLETPYEAIPPHMLWNRTSMANSYVLLSATGHALIFDYGYDFITGVAPGTDRASRRPWLYTLPRLKETWGVTQIDAVILTHYHDDHVAGCNLIRRVEGAEVWAAKNFADILENPARYDLPCLWYDPILVDRSLVLDQPIQWQEYTLTPYALPGHTRYAVGIMLEVDGQRVLVSGDQYQGGDGLEWNYVYNNRFDLDDYNRSAALYRTLAPDLILTGHWEPFFVKPDYFDDLDRRGTDLAQRHRDLLPLDEFDLRGEERAAYIHPYQITARPGDEVPVSVSVTNPFTDSLETTVTLIASSAWSIEPAVQRLSLPARGYGEAVFTLKLPQSTPPARRARIAAEVTFGERRMGQIAEALVTVQDNSDHNTT
ncbi:MAG: MBL fold metallo-hydrolase [Anaerolineae bacterium]|nr:MBL fold metallo-hydrolase [Anaerolineae bacterium]